MEDESSFFNALLNHGLQFRVTSFVQDYSGEQIVDQAQEKWFILVNLKNEENKRLNSGTQLRCDYIEEKTSTDERPRVRVP